MDASLDDFFKKAHQYYYEIPEVFFFKIAFAILNALNFMKSKSFIHRDIKPSNLLIKSDGTIKLCDFGISGLEFFFNFKITY